MFPLTLYKTRCVHYFLNRYEQKKKNKNKKMNTYCYTPIIIIFQIIFFFLINKTTLAFTLLKIFYVTIYKNIHMYGKKYFTRVEKKRKNDVCHHFHHFISSFVRKYRHILKNGFFFVYFEQTK